ncbi:hypothetical protein [Piscinibacter sp.]|uniref:McrB family protein n=1 Tax=Piscinibacter sp. TaxID=1903157 RepID=UPI001D9555D0|nr:hypothetical protein [Piscinibacter sp.]MBK7532060.1 hypothetical protein [Piscinibacter sp.]
MPGKLESDAALKAHLDAVLVGSAASKGTLDWVAPLAQFFAEVKAGIPSKLDDATFLRRLWDDNPVSATGNGTVKVGPALESGGFRQWFAGEVVKPLPSDAIEAETWLTQFYEELRGRLTKLCGRTPRLKLNRVLCAIYPQHFTCLADLGALRFLHKEMGGSTSDHPVRAHKAIRGRIDGLLGPVPVDDDLELVRRVGIPWLLYERVANDGAGESESAAPASTALKPLPATLRRKGLTAMKGGFQTLLSYLEDLREGVTKDEFTSIIKASNPDLAPNSLIAAINVVAREFDLCRRDGDTYRLSARGLNLLETLDPDEFADHLLTKVLGVDHVVKRLEAAPLAKAELIAMLQSVHPGWTTDFAPSSLLGWLTSLGVIEVGENRHYALTDRGRAWAEMVTWTPEALPKGPEAEEVLVAATPGSIALPKLADLNRRLTDLVKGRMSFDIELVAQLHAGLWFHPVRHFAVLTGISGSGKTQLALNYALALSGSQHGDSAHVRVVPVQPGWYDPSPLLGYVNPIQDSSYRSAPFLDLLLRAVADPERPYVAILDEMNLSHPEQYLAPVLSAMETHGWLDLHQLGDEPAGVPMRVQYPANLAIIGTLNMDETTHGLSDKVLDRAFTLEFWNIDVGAFPGWSTVELPGEMKQKARAVLNELVEALAPVRLHFGWRTIDDVLRYLAFHGSLGATDADALDGVVYAKVLPKLRGDTSPRFQKALQVTLEVLRKHRLERCVEKLMGMQEDLKATGSTRFWR